MSLFSLVVNTLDNAAGIANSLAPGSSINGSDAPAWLRTVESYFGAAALGAKSVAVTYADTLVAATATITSTGSAVNGETASVANQTLTAKTSGAVPANGEFNISGTVATQAASIALAINSVVALSGIVSATSSLGVVTITSTLPGNVGNGLQISESLTNVTATAFSGGSEADRATVHAGN